MSIEVSVHKERPTRRHNRKKFILEKPLSNNMVGAKKVIVDGKEWYYPINDLELFTDKVAKEFGVPLAPRTELNTEVVPEWFYEKEGELVLPSKRTLLVSYTSSLEEGLLKKDAANPGKDRFFESNHFKIMEGERHRETVVVSRLAENDDYNLSYFFDEEQEFREKYADLKQEENSYFLLHLHLILDDKTGKEKEIYTMSGRKGVAFSHAVPIRKPYTENNFMDLLRVIIKYEQ